MNPNHSMDMSQWVRDKAERHPEKPRNSIKLLFFLELIFEESVCSLKNVTAGIQTQLFEL